MTAHSLQCFLQTPPLLPPTLSCKNHHGSLLPPPTTPRLPNSISAKITQTGAASAAGSPRSNTPTQASHSSLIQSCIDSHSFSAGAAIHARMLADGFRPDAYLQTKILMLYARAGNPSDLATAREVFDGMTERNSTSWNTMILAHARVEDHEEVLDLFLRMIRSGAPPDKFTFPSVVKACVALELEGVVQQVHGLIVKTGLNSNVVVGSVLVDGYAVFGQMDDAVSVFNEIDGANVVSWNAIIGGYVRCSRWEEAWGVFCRMQSVGVSPNHSTFAAATRTCGGLRSRDGGKQVHAKLISHGFEGDSFVCNSLIDMYANCCDGESCLQVFNLMTEKNQVSWNSIISCWARLGYSEEALILFLRMQESGYKTDTFSLASVLMACASLADVETGRELHGYLIRRLLDLDFFLGTALVDLYSKCGCMEAARQVFNRLEERNEVSWNALISGYVQEGNAEAALEVYHNMKLTNTLPDQFTFSSLLSLSAKQGNAEQGKQIHAHIIRTVSRLNLIVETELVHMYAKCRRLRDAQNFFGRMWERNAYSWNSLIECCEQNGKAEETLDLFHQMQLAGISPDCFSLASTLSAVISLSDPEKGKQIHGFLIKNMLEEHNILRCMLIDMYAKCGNMAYACKAFNKMGVKDVVLHNMMITALVGCGRIDDARDMFDQMEERSILSWYSILTGYAKGGFKNEAFKFFWRMVEAGIDYDCITLVPMFNLCASLPALKQGEQLHACLVKKGFLHISVVLDSTLVDMFAKGGSIEEARRYFDMMSERNVVAWNAMISGYAKHGHSREVLTLYKQMQKEKISPNDVTFLAVLSACSHTGLVKEGLTIFTSMLQKHAIEARAEHYTCMVDLLGRAGYLDEAKELINKMPVEPVVSTWGALLGACRIHKNLDMARLASQNLFEIDPKNPGYYILLSNIYAEAGGWKAAEDIKAKINTKGVMKEPGISWIEIDNEIEIFHAGDQLHSRTADIYTTLRCLYQRMKATGYIPDINFVIHNVEDLKEDTCCNTSKNYQLI